VGVRRLLPLVVALVAQASAPASAAGSRCRPEARSAVPVPLTAAQCVEASRIVAADSTLGRLLSGRAYSVDRPDPWGSGDGVHNIGAVLKIHLRKPLDVARIVLPVADFPPGGGAYSAEHLAVSLHGATGFWVFVDLHRHRVVWVIPRPDGSEGPPPTSIPPYTAPPGFAMGTGGASPSDAARGLGLHSVTFDSTGRLVQEEWFDPLSGKAVTSIYDAERKLRVRYVSVLTGKTLTVTTIDYSAHTWTSGKRSIDPGAAGVLPLDSRTLPARIKAGRFTPDGEETVGGVNALRLRGKTGIAYFGLSLDVGGDGTVWVDPSTYLPVRQTLESRSPSGATATMTVLYSWQPRSAATAGTTTATIPTGYKHTASTGLPHIFGD
jgi:hypothetical protein